MIAVDKTILKEIDKGNIIVTPFIPENVGTNSIDLTISNKLLVYDKQMRWSETYKDGAIKTFEPCLDSRNVNPTKEIIIPETGFMLLKGECYLASTNELTETKNFVPIIEGKSSLARLFLSIHITAGFGDVGFAGNWTLELVPNENIIIYPNMKICQIVYHTITEAPLISYDKKKSAKYKNQKGIVASKNHENFN